MSTITVNGATLHHELWGDGPPLAFVSGAPGDAGFWDVIAADLADEFTVLTYDRRANSRSPRPEGWTATTVEEQADDLAALLEALGLAPAVVYGHSGGAIVLTDLALRRPDLLRGALFQEPAYASVTPHGPEVLAGVQELVGQGMADGGPRRAMELFLRHIDGDEVYEAFDPDFRERMLDNGEVLFGLEMGAFLGYRPTPDQLAGIAVPCVVTAGVDNRDPAAPLHWLHEASRWFADGLGVSLLETPGAHGPQFSHPRELVAILRPVLRELAASRPVRV